MPTGYTAAIKDGITFEQYALNCARAFGALVEMRDAPADAPIPESFAPSDYNAKALKRATAELARLKTLTFEQANAECEAEFLSAKESAAKRRIEHAELRAKYEAMLAKVEAWKSPTPEHDNYKAFMATQIRDSIQWDCSSAYDSEPQREPADVWLKAKLARAASDIAYHAKGHAEEVERTAGRNAWVKALRDSLAPHHRESA